MAPASAPRHPLAGPSAPTLAVLRLPQAPLPGLGPRGALPGSSLSCRPLSWRRRQLRATVICDHLSESAPSSRPALLPRFSPTALERGPVSGWEGREGTEAPSVLCRSATRGTSAGPSQGSRPTYRAPHRRSGVWAVPSEPPPRYRQASPPVGRWGNYPTDTLGHAAGQEH